MKWLTRLFVLVLLALAALQSSSFDLGYPDAHDEAGGGSGAGSGNAGSDPPPLR